MTPSVFDNLNNLIPRQGTPIAPRIDQAISILDFLHNRRAVHSSGEHFHFHPFGQTSFLHDSTIITPASLAAPAMATCALRRTATVFLRHRLSSHLLLPGGVRIRLPTLPPTERRLVATIAQGACFFESIFPSYYHLAKKDDAGHR